MRVTNGSSNRRDGLSVSELLMSPEIFKAVNNGGIQKLFPIHACIGNRKKGETALIRRGGSGGPFNCTANVSAGAAASSVVKADSKPEEVNRESDEDDEGSDKKVDLEYSRFKRMWDISHHGSQSNT
ncbi:unnamed protein product [Brassica rapa subsp. trilocularis]|uniref:(rape) hypothetical protein n=1 Tax=Brassica napus TaxID=3708 RepID=A0A816VZ55_BRANA|nr:unnamed protein product [Brassica napus]